MVRVDGDGNVDRYGLMSNTFIGSLFGMPVQAPSPNAEYASQKRPDLCPSVALAGGGSRLVYHQNCSAYQSRN
jgi:hypothetical protein